MKYLYIALAGLLFTGLAVFIATLIAKETPLNELIMIGYFGFLNLALGYIIAKLTTKPQSNY